MLYWILYLNIDLTIGLWNPFVEHKRCKIWETKTVKAANLIMWFQELKRKRCAISPDSRVINPGFLHVAVTPDPDIVKIGIDNIRCRKENRRILIFCLYARWQHVTWQGFDMADKNRAQGKSKKGMTKKARLKKNKVKLWAKPEIERWNVSEDSKKRRP